jgi:hypothetical protein
VCFDAIDRLDPLLNSVVATLPDRPAHGVPILLKDAGQEIAGTPHWVGVAALREISAMSTATTYLATKLERVGFSVIGKSGCPQLAAGITTEPTGFEPTRNPWRTDLSAGGSSGGSAAAVASGLVALAHGSDATEPAEVSAFMSRRRPQRSAGSCSPRKRRTCSRNTFGQQVPRTIGRCPPTKRRTCQRNNLEPRPSGHCYVLN